MRRVVVTGMGIVSSIGNTTQEVLASLREAKSGITKAEDYEKIRLPLPGAWRADSSTRRRSSTAGPCVFTGTARPGITWPWTRPSPIQA